MLTIWTRENVEAILGQLDKQNLPFKKYTFTPEDGKYVLLGKGASAYVYRAETRENHKSGYAVKVIGFGEKHTPSESFRTVVDVQKVLGLYENNIVKIHDSVELRVWIKGNNTISKLEKINPYEEKKELEGNFLHLQFIVMEEVTPVLVDNRFGKPLLRIRKLASIDEQEILKLAYDIGTALHQAHTEKLIHRDIKLENIFYTAEGEHYKLGDFGIARTTDDGLASTVAFTKGYGAPEVVGTLEDKYDYTADIYSFGMVLYVLLNGLRFPGSKNYHPNIMQYVRGFEAEYPAAGSDALCEIVLKMISFDPDDRYQTMEEVLNEFDRLKFGGKLKYQREHKTTSLAVGAAFAALGAAACEISFMPGFINDFSLWTYLFWGLCIGKGIAKLRSKDLTWISYSLLCLGTYLMISTGFTWWKLLGVLILSFFWDVSAGIMGGSMMLMCITNAVMKTGMVGILPEYGWISALLISLSFFLLLYHFILDQWDEKITKMYLGKDLYWSAVAVLYAFVALADRVIRASSSFAAYLYEGIFGGGIAGILLNMDLLYICVPGAAFCLIWICREMGLIFIEKQMEKRKMY